jgi:hypothetical protein
MAAAKPVNPLSTGILVQQDQQHLFQVISNDIKQLILGLKNEAANGKNLNEVVKQTVSKLENMGDQIGLIAGISIKNNEVLSREKMISQAITRDPLKKFINARDKTTTNEGVLSFNNTHISLKTLDEVPDKVQNRLETDYEGFPANDKQIEDRLINCQYLEILYLTKHDELLKVFNFTLDLYNKYTYAIKILLFVLKNLFDKQPCDKPDRQDRPVRQDSQGTTRNIRLPRALISDIKQLLIDQKQVQTVIDKMKSVVDTTVPELVKKSVADSVSSGILGDTNDEQNPNPPPRR